MNSSSGPRIWIDTISCMSQQDIPLERQDGATADNSAQVHRRLGRRLGLRGAAAHRSATWPFGLVGLRATSPTRDPLCAIASKAVDAYYAVMRP
jgi:hypothetical protein